MAGGAGDLVFRAGKQRPHKAGLLGEDRGSPFNAAETLSSAFLNINAKAVAEGTHTTHVELAGRTGRSGNGAALRLASLHISQQIEIGNAPRPGVV